MKKRHLLFFATIILSLSGCATVPTDDMKFESQFDPRANFSGYKSFGWLVTAEILNDSMGQWEPRGFDADKQIKFLIDRELRDRGLSEKAGNPDIYVSFAAGVNMDSVGLKTDPDKNFLTLTNIPRGALVVALVDRLTGFVIWTGVVTGDVAKTSPDVKTAKGRLDYAVTTLLKKIPE